MDDVDDLDSEEERISGSSENELDGSLEGFPVDALWRSETQKTVMVETRWRYTSEAQRLL